MRQARSSQGHPDLVRKRGIGVIMATEPTRNEREIFVDGQRYQVSSPTYSGAQLKALAHKDAIYQVFQEGVGTELDRLIPDHEAIVLQNGLRFYTVPPALAGLPV
jgi:hypothetical protein